ncbi:hypothetical protein FE697_015240 [Mumia zhuanghuii]|uniref:Sap, sulfolipid-1-addressing protein n=2 Tax=Mumia TaxID=1546255 RepID=A0ABW1QQF3_9ACTN|nr:MULTISPECIES: hypothetical protein [Mumia]KAA1422486.1 hypothetical protein FE697_015240 [Mumia zhuanghuii]
MLHAAVLVVGTLVSLVLLGLATGFSPTLIALQVAVLARSPGSLRRGLIVAGGVATGALILTLLLQVTNPDAWERLFSGRVRSLLLQRAFDLTAGVLFVIAGLWVLRNRHATVDHTAVRTASRLLDRPRSLFGFSAANTVIGVSAAASAYLVVRLAREASSAGILQVLVYVGFAMAAALPYLLMAWGTERFPILSRAVDRMTGWIRSRSWRTVGGVLLVAVGGLLVVASLTRYFGRG